MNRARHLLATALLVTAASVTLLVPTAVAERNEGATPEAATSQSRVAVGGLHTCAVLNDGKVQCWGNNEQGQLGNGTTTTSTVPQTVTGITAATAVAAGNNHTCALLSGGTAQCWGLTGNGQVGDGTTYDATQNSQLVLPLLRLRPVTVSGLSGALSISAGGFHTCAVVSGGSVKCWGDDGIGQLGDNKPGDKSLVATTVPGLSGVTGIAMGEFHTCALLAAGTVKCWGHNGTGQLGDGTKADRAAPVGVVGLPDPAGATPNPVVAITAGYGHTCVIVKDGTARCWGENTFGQLGYPTPVGTPAEGGRMTPSVTPQPVQRNTAPPSPLNPSPSTVAQDGLTAISAGQFHTCAMLETSAAACWGQNGRGQLGTDPNPLTSKLDDSTTAVAVAGLAGATAVTAGGFHSCAAQGGAMVCWGYNFYGQLGSSAPGSAVPVIVTAITGATEVSVGNGSVCALIDADTPRKPHCWGDNSLGQLGGDPAVTKASIRIPVTGIPSASAIDVGNGHACALPQGSSSPQCWGFNATGQVGDGTTINRFAPAPVSGLTTAITVSAGGGLGTAERGHSCSVTSAGTVQCWGRNASGQLADGTADDRSTPVTVQRDDNFDHAEVTLVGLGGVVAVTTGGLHTCALAADATVWCWGANGSGQLGDGSTTERHFAVHVQADGDDPDNDHPLTGVLAIEAGGSYTCARLTGGKVKCWGNNGRGQLGNGSTAPQSYPTTVSGLGGVAGNLATQADLLTAGNAHACARRVDGALVCWGSSSHGQVGDGSLGSDRTTPSVVADMGPTDGDVPNSSRPVVKSVSAGRSNTCAVLVDTAVRCWGDNATNQLGDGIGPSSVAPVAVALTGML